MGLLYSYFVVSDYSIIINSLVAIMFYSFGYLYKVICKSNDKYFNNNIIYLIFAIILILFLYFVSDKNDLVFMTKNYYGNPLLFFVCSIFGTLSILYISKFINSSKVFSFFGKNSLIMLSTQFPIFRGGQQLINLFSDNVIFINDLLKVLINFIFTVLLEIVVIKVVNKYFPSFNGNFKTKKEIKNEKRLNDTVPLCQR